MEYKTKNHSKFLLIYHIIFICKYRRKILSNFDSDLKASIQKIASENDFTIIEMETDKDHIHLLVESEPKISVLMIVRLLKQRTTHDMWQKYGNLLKLHYRREHTLWSNGYFVCSIGNASQETIRKYIQQQG